MLESPASRSCFEISVRKTRTELRFPDLRTRFPGPSYEAVNDGLRPVRPHRRVRGSETLPRGSRTSFREPRFEVRVSRSSLTTWDCETRSEISEAVSASEKVAKFAGCVTVIHGFGRAAFRGLRLFTEVRGR